LKFQFDKNNNSLYIKLNENKIIESEEIANNFIVDFDTNGNIVGFEVLNLQTFDNFEIPLVLQNITKDKLSLQKAQ